MRKRDVLKAVFSVMFVVLWVYPILAQVDTSWVKRSSKAKNNIAYEKKARKTSIDTSISTKSRIYIDSLLPSFLTNKSSHTGHMTSTRSSSLNPLTDSDDNGFEDQYEQELAEKFCPCLILHSGDQGVSPEPVEIINQIIWGHCWEISFLAYHGEAETKIVGNDYSWIDWWTEFTEYGYKLDPTCYSETYHRTVLHFDYAGPGPDPHCDEILSGAYYDQPPGWYDAYANGNAYVNRGSSYDHTVYTHLFTHEGEYVIQYWFFYPFNDFVNDHEGDWEHINVVITSQDPEVTEIDRVIYYFHKYYWKAHTTQEENPSKFDCYVIDGTHPVVFVGGYAAKDYLGSHGEGHGSHGSYPIYGSWWRIQPETDYGIIPDAIPQIDETVDGQGRFIPYTHFIDDDTADNDGVVVIKGKEDYDYTTNPEMSWLAAKMFWGYPWVHSFCTHLDGVSQWNRTKFGNRPPEGPVHNEGWEVVDSNVGEANGIYGLALYDPLPAGLSHVSNRGWSPPMWFVNADKYSAGDYPISVFPGDLDGDGDLDLAVANYGSHNVSILENNGNGVFTKKADYVTGNNPVSVFCADLDGDSDLDLAVVNSGGVQNVSVLKNDGSGNFPTIDYYGVGSIPLSVFCGDLDGDDDLDLAVANLGSGNVSILKNYGNGTFQDAINYAAGDGPSSVFCADLDGDGDLDLAVANETFASKMYILKNNGHGVFAIDSTYRAGDGSCSIFSADLDGDSDLDLAVANSWSDNISVLKNNGNGTFQNAITVWAGDDPYSVFCADLDGDSDLDLAVANYKSNDVFVIENNGNATFGRAFNYGAGGHPTSVFCGDWDGDGDLDLAVTSSGSDSISILKDTTQVPVNQRPRPFSLLSPMDGAWVFIPIMLDWHTPYDPNFGDQIRYDLYVSTDPFFVSESTTVYDSLTISRFTVNLNVGTYYWKVRAYDNWGAERWSNETWSFVCPQSLDSIPFAQAVNYVTRPCPSSVFCADLDGDSALDLAVTSDIWNGTVSILKNNGYGEFPTKVDYQTGQFPMSIFCADLDNDSDLDLAIARGDDLEPTISILKNTGNGEFPDRDEYGACSRPWSIFCADLDGDSDLDLAVANYGSTNVSILKNKGDGTFQDTVNYPVGDASTSVFCADLDGDGDRDLAVTVYTDSYHLPGYVSILKNNGIGQFPTRDDYDVGNGPWSVSCGDFDGDSVLDLAVANSMSWSVSILKNKGDGTFQNATNYNVAGSPRSIFCADLDSDGDLDLALVTGTNKISILKNNGSGSFLSEFQYGAGDLPWSVFCADLDKDTDLDIAVANYNSHNVSILKNLSIVKVGDVNGDGKITVTDVIYLVNYLFKGGPAPVHSGDANHDGKVSVSDVVYLVNYLFKDGPAPCK